ncbi:hypothetical protein [Streptomyces sp. NPDC001876]
MILTFFLTAACIGLAGLYRVDRRTVRATTATLALITVLAAIAAAIPH